MDESVPQSVPDRYREKFSAGKNVRDKKKADVLAEIGRIRNPLVTIAEITANVEHSKKTVERSIDELRSDGILIQLEKVENVNIYYLNHEETEYPMPPDVQTGEDLVQLDWKELLTLDNPNQLRLIAFGIAVSVWIWIGIALGATATMNPSTAEYLVGIGFANMMLAIGILGLAFFGEQLPWT